MAYLSCPCPFCGHGRTEVHEALWDDHYKTVRRIRLCPNCHYRWSTVEIDHDQAQALERKSLPSWREDNPEGEQKPLR